MIFTRIRNLFYGILLSILFISLIGVYRNYSVLAVVQTSEEFTNPIIIIEPPAYNWTQTSLVSTESINDTTHPSQAVDSKGNVHVVWVDKTNYSNSGVDSDIFYRYLDRETGNWLL